jgi:hypothetical protein
MEPSRSIFYNNLRAILGAQGLGGTAHDPAIAGRFVAKTARRVEKLAFAWAG